jgi:hypothetical protein
MGKVGGKRKVTKEIADFIRKKHEEGKKHKEIRRLVKERYSVELDLSTITRYYKRWDEVLEAYRDQAKRQKRERYDRVYHKHYRRLDRYLNALFSESEALSLEEISSYLKKRTGIYFKPETLEKKINAYAREGRLYVERDEMGIYRKRR